MYLINVSEGHKIYVLFYYLFVDMHFNKGILQQCIVTIANIYPH